MHTEKIKSICQDIVPAIEKLQEAITKNGIKGGLILHLGEDGWFSFEGRGLGGWSISKFQNETSIKYEYREATSSGVKNGTNDN